MSRAVAPEDVFGLTGTLLADRFRVEGQIAEGGFGIVYRASQVALDRAVAIKVLKTPPGLDGDAREAFRAKFADEAKTIAKLKDPHIVDVYDFGIARTAGGELAPWMALEWIDGETLETLLSRRRGAGGRSARDAVDLLRPVIAALAHAHRQGIAHRDIKPANIMVSQGDAGPVLRILDFGIAKIMRADEGTGTGRTRTNGMPAFSPAYAAPEQVSFSRTGPWTDVHAIGLVLTEVMTDEAPFPATDMHVFEQVMAATRPTPLTKGKDVGADVEAAMARTVALSPGERWKDAGDLLRQLDKALAADGARPSSKPGVDTSADTQPIGAPSRPGSKPPAAAEPAASGAEAGRERTGRRAGPLVAALLGAVAVAAGAIIVLARRNAEPALPPAPPPVAERAPSAAPPPAPVAPPAETPPLEVAPAPAPKTVEARPRSRSGVRREARSDRSASGESASVAIAPAVPAAVLPSPVEAPAERKKTGVLHRFEKLVDRPVVEDRPSP